ncbi:MAG: hypothetical protein H6811_07335 [Phycisphaeraceae bacterium]|nr:hypothetical protein [Phycisphaeraceae bacterium]
MPTPAKRTLTREDLVRIGRSGDPWEFLPLVAQALRLAPEDHGLRFLFAASLARAGLRTLALNQLEVIPGDAGATAELGALRRAASGLPVDEIPFQHRVAVCRSNVAALGSRGVDLARELQRWEARASVVRAFRALKGDVVLADPLAAPAEWIGLAGSASACHDVARGFTELLDDQGPPVVVEGVNPPIVFRTVFDATRPDSLGHSPCIAIVQADPIEALDGLSVEDLTERLSDDRVICLVGPDAPDRLGSWMRSRDHLQVFGPYVVTPGTRVRPNPALADVLSHVARERRERADALRVSIRERYASRQASWWRRRYQEAMGSGRPLGVLIPTCRYSTYIQHASRDLARAFEREGWRSRVLIEPDDHSRLSTIAHREAIAEFEPDLIVVINYTRAALGEGVVPRDVPFACWIQDAMPHLFDAEVGKAMGPLDFVVGHVTPELIERYQYPASRMLAKPVIVDPETFCEHRSERDQFVCELACVTNHAETPEALHARLRSEAGAPGPLGRALDGLFEQIQALAPEAHRVNLHRRIRELVHDAMRREVGSRPGDEANERVIRGYALPVADRVLRHQALDWAAAVCDRRQWRFHLYGRGWGAHPTLSRFAMGEVRHGEPLRAVYRDAALSLHVSASTMVHQRIMECSLSGGLCAARLVLDGMSLSHARAQRALAESTPIGRDTISVRREGRDVSISRDLFAPVDHPLAMGYVAQRQRLEANLEAEQGGQLLAVPVDRAKRLAAFPGLVIEELDATWLLGDLSEITFWSEASLERVAQRAIHNSSWRANLRAGTASRVRARLTTDAMIRELLGLIRGALVAADEPMAKAA